MKQNGIFKIAELAEVSIGTVDRALHGRSGISETTRNKVLRIARELNYSPNPAARTLSKGRANLRIGVCIPREIRFYYDQMRAGMLDEAQRVRSIGLELVHRPVPRLGAGEKKQLAALLDDSVNAIILTPGNPEIAGPLIDRAEESCIRVVCITTDAPMSKRSSIVAVDPELSGRLAAELMARFVPAGSKVAVMTGMLSTTEHRLKATGFALGFSGDCPGGEVVAVLEAHESEDESYDKTCDLLNREPKLQGIYVSTVNCLPVCKALCRLNLDGKVALITTDVFPQMVDHLLRGTIRTSIYQNPYLQGQTAVRTLVDHLLNGFDISPSYLLSPTLVLKSNLRTFREASDHVPALSATDSILQDAVLV